MFLSLRLGYIVCPTGLRDDLYRAKRFDDLGSRVTKQAAVATFMQSRQFDNHQKSTVAELNLRRRVFVEGLRRHGGTQVTVQDARAGMHVVVWMNHMTYTQLDKLIKPGIERGLGLYPIRPHFNVFPVQPVLLLEYARL